MLQSYEGYVENGKIIPQGNPLIPDGSPAIITILTEPFDFEARLARQIKALRDFEEGLAECDEPLPPEFDEILSKRVNITRNAMA